MAKLKRFTVRPYEEGDEQGIVALFNRVFSEDNPAFEGRSVETWRGIYRDNPSGMQTFVATDADGAIVANYSSIPAPCVVRGERRLCTQAVDSCVDRAWRGRLSKHSVFVTLATEFIRHFSTVGGGPFDDYMWGLPNEQALPVGVRIIGYRPVHCPMPALVLRATPRAAEALSGRTGDVRVEEAPGGAPAEVAGLFERHLDAVPLGIWKDEAYLAWRYRTRPDVTYRWLLARRADELVACLILRMGWMGQPLVALVDWIGPGQDEEALAALLARAVGMTLEAGGAVLETWCTPGMAQDSVLRRLGMRHQDSRFNLCIMTFGPDLKPDWVGTHWSVTMGDSDIY